MSDPPKTDTLLIFCGYGLSILLVLVYVQMFPLFSLLNRNLNREFLFMLPSTGTLLLLGALLLIYRYHLKAQAGSCSTLPVIIGTIVCCVALGLPDPSLPVKRIHVPEYLFLSLVIRFTMSYRLQGQYLLFFSACFTALLGIHDEILQGLHPSRTYGLRDMAVNGLAGFGGALIWHGFGLFRRDIPSGTGSEGGNKLSTLIYLALLFTGVLALVWPLAFYRTAALPSWPVTPLLGAIVFFTLYHNDFGRALKHGLAAISGISFLLIIYPVVATSCSIFFY